MLAISHSLKSDVCV